MGIRGTHSEGVMAKGYAQTVMHHVEQEVGGWWWHTWG